MITFSADKYYAKLTKAILKQRPELSYNELRKAIRNKDIKINGVRIDRDVELSQGDKVEIYIKPRNFETYRQGAVYEDQNIAVFYKPKGVQSVGEDSLSEKLKNFYDYIEPCHRLDTNTDGLMIFALNENAYNELLFLIKERKIRKFYKAIVYGEPKGKKLTLFLVKDSKTGIVKAYEKQVRGASKAETEFRIIKSYGDCSEIEAELLTGKTHQIRVSFAHFGNPILGDGKYGSNTLNRAYKVHKQCLTAYKLKFNTERSKIFNYLNGKIIEIPVKFPVKKQD